MPIVPANEVTELFRAVIRGESSIKLLGNKTWEGAFAANLDLDIDGNIITVFNDCNSFDYIDSVKMSDGRRAEFEDWKDSDTGFIVDPSSLLMGDELKILESIIVSLLPEERG